MTKSKKMKPVNKTINNLIRYSETATWAPLFDFYFDGVMSDVAKWLNSDLDSSDLINMVEGSGCSSMLFGYVFEGFATYKKSLTEIPSSFVEDYCQRRGWREPPHGLAYLRLLNQSRLDIWEVVDVTPGASIDLRRLGVAEKPTRIIEISASQSVKKWDCLIARVLQETSTCYVLAGGVLPLKPDEAQSLLGKRQEAIAIWEQNAFDDNAMIHELTSLYLSCWVSSIVQYTHRTQSFPTIVNKEGDTFLPNRTVFRIKLRKKTKVAFLLSEADWLTCVRKNKEWLWLMPEQEKRSERSIFGVLEIEGNSLYFEANSSERAELGIQKIKMLLGEIIELPYTLYESNEHELDEKSSEIDPAEVMLDVGEHTEIIQSYLEQHYRSVLDESVPALDGLTPYECARKKTKRPQLLAWVKQIESSICHMPNMASYDFSWFRKALGFKENE